MHSWINREREDNENSNGHGHLSSFDADERDESASVSADTDIVDMQQFRTKIQNHPRPGKSAKLLFDLVRQPFQARFPSSEQIPSSRGSREVEQQRAASSFQPLPTPLFPGAQTSFCQQDELEPDKLSQQQQRQQSRSQPASSPPLHHHLHCPPPSVSPPFFRPSTSSTSVSRAAIDGGIGIGASGPRHCRSQSVQCSLPGSGLGLQTTPPSPSSLPSHHLGGASRTTRPFVASAAHHSSHFSSRLPSAPPLCPPLYDLSQRPSVRPASNVGIVSPGHYWRTYINGLVKDVRKHKQFYEELKAKRSLRDKHDEQIEEELRVRQLERELRTRELQIRERERAVEEREKYQQNRRQQQGQPQFGLAQQQQRRGPSSTLPSLLPSPPLTPPPPPPRVRSPQHQQRQQGGRRRSSSTTSILRKQQNNHQLPSPVVLTPAANQNQSQQQNGGGGGNGANGHNRAVNFSSPPVRSVNLYSPNRSAQSGGPDCSTVLPLDRSQGQLAPLAPNPQTGPKGRPVLVSGGRTFPLVAARRRSTSLSSSRSPPTHQQHRNVHQERDMEGRRMAYLAEHQSNVGRLRAARRVNRTISAKSNPSSLFHFVPARE